MAQLQSIKTWLTRWTKRALFRESDGKEKAVMKNKMIKKKKTKL